MIVDDDFIKRFKSFPMGKSHVVYENQRYRTYRETFNERAKRDLCIAISLQTGETLVQFNLYHTSKTVRLKMSEGAAVTAVDFIKNFAQDIGAPEYFQVPGEPPQPVSDTPPSVKHARKRRFFKFLS